MSAFVVNGAIQALRARYFDPILLDSTTTQHNTPSILTKEKFGRLMHCLCSKGRSSLLYNDSCSMLDAWTSHV